jgi:hypothetical protein
VASRIVLLESYAIRQKQKPTLAKSYKNPE